MYLIRRHVCCLVTRSTTLLSSTLSAVVTGYTTILAVHLQRNYMNCSFKKNRGLFRTLQITRPASMLLLLLLLLLSTTTVTVWSRLLQKLTVHSASQEIPRLLWNQKIHYRVHNSSPEVPIPSQINPVYTFPPYLSKTLFDIVLSYHLRLRLPNGVFPSGFPNKFCTHLSPLYYTPCPSHPPCDHSNNIWRRIQSSTTSGHFIPLRSKYSPHNSVLKHR
jgi:hypothetical protein